MRFLLTSLDIVFNYTLGYTAILSSFFPLKCFSYLFWSRKQLKDQLLVTPMDSSAPAILLLEVVVLLIDPKLPWSCKIVGYLLQKNVFSLLREIVLMGKVCA